VGNGLAYGMRRLWNREARVARARAAWLCFLLLACAVGASTEGSAAERDVALISFDPMSDGLSATRKCTLDVTYDGTLVSVGLRAYHLEITCDSRYAFVENLDVDVAEGSFLRDVGVTAFFVERVDAGTFVVDSALLGATAGATGVGDLCSITFTGGTGDGITVVEFSEVELRSVGNTWIPDSSAFAVLRLDNTQPETEAGPVAQYHNVLSFDVPFAGQDSGGTGLQYVELHYQVDGGGYVQYGSTFTASPIAFEAPGEGIYEFYTIGTDHVGNIEDAPPAADCMTEVDSTPPPSPGELVAMPGHNAVSLSWTAPVSRGSPTEGTLLVRKPWGFWAYPEYDDDGEPYGYPMYEEDGQAVGFVPGTGPQTFEDTDFDDSSRNVYYYTAFTKDSAGNYSVADSAAQDRSTSYWLADVRDSTGAPSVYDGLVNYYDKIAYSYSYYSADGEPHYDNELDVGPTDDGSPTGIPLTDNIIDFEDLMILSQNYGSMPPGGSRESLPFGDATRAPAVLALALKDAGFAVGDTVSLDLTLRSGEEHARGVSSVVTFSDDSLEFLSAAQGTPADRAGESFFFAGEEAPGRVRVDLAALGTEAAIPVACVVATLEFLVRTEESCELGIDEATLRDSQNSDIACLTSGLHIEGGDGVPRALRLRQNTPNPFNPRTSIEFDVPERCRVRLQVFGVDGREVATLVDEVLGAGVYDVPWNGIDDRGVAVASGVYFYVLDAGGLRLTQKMVLMR
jgi:hypothetical protein